jgi:hypothetical protein
VAEAQDRVNPAHLPPVHLEHCESRCTTRRTSRNRRDFGFQRRSRTASGHPHRTARTRLGNNLGPHAARPRRKAFSKRLQSEAKLQGAGGKALEVNVDAIRANPGASRARPREAAPPSSRFR